VTAVRKLMSKMVPSEHAYLSDKLHSITPLKTTVWTYTALISLSIKWEFRDQL